MQGHLSLVLHRPVHDQVPLVIQIEQLQPLEAERTDDPVRRDRHQTVVVAHEILQRGHRHGGAGRAGERRHAPPPHAAPELRVRTQVRQLRDALPAVVLPAERACLLHELGRRLVLRGHHALPFEDQVAREGEGVGDRPLLWRPGAVLARLADEEAAAPELVAGRVLGLRRGERSRGERIPTHAHGEAVGRVEGRRRGVRSVPGGGNDRIRVHRFSAAR
mmetsp:Transcript_14469/g.28954  ORF Transcript_14469/g.28954 Transcript_14469/m.28954 type:complete len:219 (+) Transcript_14469:1304-1960(+)